MRVKKAGRVTKGWVVPPTAVEQLEKKFPVLNFADCVSGNALIVLGDPPEHEDIQWLESMGCTPAVVVTYQSNGEALETKLPWCVLDSGRGFIAISKRRIPLHARLGDKIGVWKKAQDENDAGFDFDYASGTEDADDDAEGTDELAH